MWTITGVSGLNPGCRVNTSYGDFAAATLERLERRVGIWQKEPILLGRAPLGFRPGQQTLQCLNQGH